MRMQTTQGFFGRPLDIRAHFDEHVGPARSGAEGRFVWDYWHIPGQYTYFRTPAISVIPPSLLASFTEVLRDWGDQNLGSRRVTAPWLSYYVEGCRQELHSDVVQGTWSYVYSLTRWGERKFTGGETLLATERLLGYWAEFDPEHSSESRHLVERVPALFDQLCVFDSRLPHGVSVVEGTRDPLEARVALHGWFHDPEPRAEGALALSDAEPTLADLRIRWDDQRSRLGTYDGKAVWRLSVEPAGEVADVTLVVENLVSLRAEARDPSDLVSWGESLIREARFPASDGPSTLILPL